MNVYVIPNLRKACEVLKTLSQNNHGYTIAEIAKRHAIPRTTALRILSTLTMEGFLVKTDGRYRPGAALYHLGLHSLAAMDLRTVSVPVLLRLAQETGETSHLAVPCGDQALIIEVCDSPHPVRVASRAGTLVGLHCSATGKVLAAHHFGARIGEIFRDGALERHTPNTIGSLEAFMKEIDTIRRRGFGVDDEESYPGVRCVAAPIRDARATVVGAIGVTATATRFTKNKIGAFAEIVIRAADAIAKDLGYRPASPTGF